MTPTLLRRLPAVKWISILALSVFVWAWGWVISPYESFWYFIKENLGVVSGYALLVVLILYISFSLIEYFVAKNVRINRWLEEVYRITREVQAEEHVEDLLQKVVGNILEVFEFDRIALFLETDRQTSGKLKVRAHLGFPHGQLDRHAIDLSKSGEIQQSIQAGQMKIYRNFGDVALEREVLLGQDESGSPERFALIPVRQEGRTVGALYVDRVLRRPGRRLLIETEELRILATYLDQVTVMMERLQLLNKEKELSKTLSIKVDEALTRERQLEEKLRLSETLAALGEMAASLTHEIKNPLGGLDLYARMLHQDISSKDIPDSEKKEVASKIIDGVKSLNTIVGNLLGYARVARGEMGERLAISDVLSAAADFARPEMQRVGVSYTCEIPPNLHVSGNFDQLRQVFLNLLLNGVQSMVETGGTLTVRAAKREGRAGGSRRLWVVTEISDTGIGMTEEQKGRIFEDFYTTREKGTGLGLAISRKIVKVHGGEITFESEWKKGSTFRVYLPAVAAAEPAGLPASAGKGVDIGGTSDSGR